MDETLRQFIREALGRGISKKEIEATLIKARWPHDEVQSALDSFADIEFPIPVPRPKPYVSARETFVYLVLFTLLYLSAWNLGSLLFQFIHRAFPDATQQAFSASFSLRAVRWAVAALLIAFPGYLLLSRKAYRSARRDPERRKSKVRKWLTYVTLFVTASVLLGDVITLIFNLLEGELTVRFLLKVLTVGAIAGSVFGYYFWDLRQDDRKQEEVPARQPGLRAFAGGIIVAVLAAVVGGLFMAGSPGRARGLQLDRERESHLSQISGAIDRYWNEFEKLPEDLETLEETRGYRIASTRDPETQAPYEYRITGASDYELCATFAAGSDVGEPAPMYRRYGGASKFWEHDAGRDCFSIDVKLQDD